MLRWDGAGGAVEWMYRVESRYRSVCRVACKRVFITLDVLNFLGFTPLGKTDLLIIVFVAPESNKTLRTLLL